MKISLSIVVAAYNVRNYIEPCVQSILEQLLPGQELIVINDGSTDDTLALLDAMHQASRTEHFRIVSQANQGISGARNTGIELATGEYLMFVDGDDVVRPGSLALLDRTITLQHPDAIAFDLRNWHPGNEQRSRRIARGYPVETLLSDQTTILNILFADRLMYPWCNVYRRSIYLQMPGPVFPPGRVFEDISTTPRLLSLCENLWYLPHEIINYRQHPTSITKRITETSSRDLANALSLAKQFLAERGVNASVKRHFNLAAAYFYISAVKDSYQLSTATGRRLRDQIKPVFAQTLFGDCASIYTLAKARDMVSHDRSRDAKTLRQVRSAMNDSFIFDFKLSVSRKFKLWLKARKLRKQAAPTLPPFASPQRRA
jgi:glycosyltransferase involved in cell wall biosynthesis